MSLSPRQQGLFRPLVNDAWEKTCARDSTLDQSDRRVREKWYRAELMKALGIYSTNEAPAREQFAKLCAHFEQIVGRSAYWTIRAEQPEEVRQLRFWIDQALKRIGGDWKYAQGVIEQMNFPGLDLDDLDVRQLKKVFQALDTHLRRHCPENAADWKDQVRQLTNATIPHRRAA